MIVLEAGAVFIGVLGFLALGSPGLPYQWALFMGITYGVHATELYSRMPSVLDRRWAILASVAAALCSLAFVSQTLWVLLLALIAVAAVITYTSVRGYGFVKAAAKDLGLPRP